jgi:hypothetical protein
MDRHKSSCNEALSAGRNNPRFKSLGFEPKLHKIGEKLQRLHITLPKTQIDLNR